MPEPSADPPRILARPEHPVSRQNIDTNALKVLHRLQRKDFETYLVGGAVRDLMLGVEPKDYDIATSARPQEIRRLFRNSRTIGRRFRLVHVFFHNGLIEVSTFRARPREEYQDSAPDELLVTDDNAYGSLEDDAFRRDFTVNALYYSIDDFSVVDYTGGVEDLEQRLIRVIGDPDVRFLEDPVRMLRACEMAARLDFKIERRAQSSIQRNASELAKATAPRLCEEVRALFRCGASAAAVQWMIELDLLHVLLPELLEMVEAERMGLGDFPNLLQVLDAKANRGEAIEDDMLFALLLAPAVVVTRHRSEEEEGRALSRKEVAAMIEEIVAPFAKRFAISYNRYRRSSRILETFQRLCEPPSRPREWPHLVRHMPFDDALALFELFVQATGDGDEMVQEWKNIRRKADNAARRGSRGKKRRPRRRRRRRR